VSQVPFISPDNGLALLAFKIGQNQFDLNRGLAYISMRDQVIRARTLVHSVLSAGIFERRTAESDRQVDVDVLIVGAGVGGVSVALAAAEVGLRTLVVEKESECFSLLHKGTNRLLSTTLYDWPARHFNRHAFPDIPCTEERILKDASVLRFLAKPCPAQEIADHLNQQVANFRTKYSNNLHIECDFEISSGDDITWAGRRALKIDLGREISLFKEKKSSVYARIVVYAIGFGSEKALTKVDDVRDSFWGYESIENDLGKIVNSPARVCVIGAGDGGLQEILRVILSPNEYHDFANTISELESVIGEDREWSDGLKSILFAEDNAARALMWGYRPDLIFPRVQAVHEEVIKTLLDKKNLARRAAVIAWRDKVCRHQDIHVTLYDSLPISNRVYALNRFLFELLSTLSKDSPGTIKIHRSMEDWELAKNTANANLVIDRRGVSPIDNMYGTSEKEDWLRRMMFRALPNHYSMVA